MKKLLILIIMCTLLLAGCGKEAVQTVEPPVVEQPQEQVVENEYYKKMNSDVRPVAVMIDNDSWAARPQLGLESADVVYEIIVEGGATRFMALFKDHNIEKIGPIRSSRHYFLDYALEHDAIYCHAGWSPKAQNDIPALGINNINGVMGGDSAAFYRDSTYDNSWHNLYSGIIKLTDMASKKGYKLTSDKKHLTYGTEEFEIQGNTAQKISLPYSNLYKVTYEYDAENKVYKRYINGREHTSQKDGILTAKNIIIYQVTNYDLNDGSGKGRQDIKNIGNGTGYYVTNGIAAEINWSKKTRGGKTEYTTKDGETLVVNPGNTYIQIVPSNQKISIE